MKKLLTGTYLLISITSFPLWKMKGIYQDLEPNNWTGQVIKLPSTFEFKNNDQKDYFLYDRHTLTVLKVDALQFLKCEFDYNQAYWNNLYSNTMTRWLMELKVNSNGSIKKMNGYRSMFMTPFEKKFTYVNNVKFKNQDNKVILKKENKNINLDFALKNYFTQSKVTNINRLYLDQKAFDRLQTSTILAIWDIYRGKIKPESSDEIFDAEILVGLAKNKKGKLFHYTIALKENVSVLMQDDLDKPNPFQYSQQSDFSFF